MQSSSRTARSFQTALVFKGGKCCHRLIDHLFRFFPRFRKSLVPLDEIRNLGQAVPPFLRVGQDRQQGLPVLFIGSLESIDHRQRHLALGQVVAGGFPGFF